MKMDIPLKCSCGSLKGTALNVSPDTGNHLICMCDDCRSYVQHLKREKDILDANGGTEIFQLTPAQIKFTAGTQNLRCLRLTPKGLLRWYAGCCNTPVANTLPTPKIPFAGIPVFFFDFASVNQQSSSVLGPIRERIFGRFGIGVLPPGTQQKASPALLLRTLRILFISKLKGMEKPHPFFDAKTGKMILEPEVLGYTA